MVCVGCAGQTGDCLVARRILQMTRKRVVKSVQELKDEAIIIAFFAPCIDQAQKMIMISVFFPPLEKLFDAQRGRNFLSQHLNSIPNH